jgi:hypothetical protein
MQFAANIADGAYLLVVEIVRLERELMKKTCCSSVASVNSSERSERVVKPLSFKNRGQSYALLTTV